MKQPNRPFRSLAFAAVAAFSTLAAVPAASAADVVGKITFDDLPTPEFQVNTKNKPTKPKDWLEVEAELNLQPKTPEQKKSGFIDSVTVKWYVGMKSVEGGATGIKLMKEITYLNVPCTEATYVSAYLPPTTVKRLTGQEKAGKQNVDAVGIEVLIGGEKVGAQSVKAKVDWWTSPKLSDMSTKYPLLNKDETPFSQLWYDRYPEIQKKS